MSIAAVFRKAARAGASTRDREMVAIDQRLADLRGIFDGPRATRSGIDRHLAICVLSQDHGRLTCKLVQAPP